MRISVFFMSPGLRPILKIALGDEGIGGSEAFPDRFPHIIPETLVDAAA